MLARVRISVLDRPGSLGRVASAIGEASGDIATVDVLETSAGRALDDVFVQVSDVDHLGRVTASLSALPGVELLGTQHPAPPATGRAELELVQRVLSQPGRALQTLVDGAPGAVGADWAAVLAFGPDGGQSGVVATSTRAPSPEGLRTNAPLRLAAAPLKGLGESALVPLDGEPLGLLLVREHGVAFHRTELWRLGHLGDVVGHVLRPAPGGATG